MAAAVYFLCTLTALACAVLLLRRYNRTRVPLLWWSGLCFAGLTLDNLCLFVDRILFPAVDLAVYRRPVALISVALLLYGMIWKTK